MRKFKIGDSQDENEKVLGFKTKDPVTFGSLRKNLEDKIMKCDVNVRDNLNRSAAIVAKAVATESLEKFRMTHCVDRVHVTGMSSIDYSDSKLKLTLSGLSRAFHDQLMKGLATFLVCLFCISSTSSPASF